jgi:hypothetical protein
MIPRSTLLIPSEARNPARADGPYYFFNGIASTR